MSDVPMGMKIHLPKENWLDIFSFVPRRMLASGAATANRYLASIVQPWLHQKRGKVTLAWLKIYNDYDSARTLLVNAWDEHVDFPEVPPPKNVVNFEKIVLYICQKRYHQDIPSICSPVERLLTLMSPLFLAANTGLPINIRIENYASNQLLAKLTSILWPSNHNNKENTSKETIVKKTQQPNVFVDCLRIFTEEERVINFSNLNTESPALFANTRVLCLCGDEVYVRYEALDFFCAWLNDTEFASKWKDGTNNKSEPRMLVLEWADVFAAELIWRIRQEFFVAASSSPVTFFVCMRISELSVLEPLPEFYYENNQTQEVYSLAKFSNKVFVLSRYELARGGEWVREKVAAVLDLEKNKGKIVVGSKQQRDIVVAAC